MTVAHGHPWAVWGRTFALMSITHPFGSDVKSMSEFYNKRFLRAVTLVEVSIHFLTPVELISISTGHIIDLQVVHFVR